MGLVNKLRKWLILYKNQFELKNLENNRCENNDKVLIIKLDAIGDFIIWLDAAKEFRNIYPDKKCVLLCNKLCEEIAKETGYFDDVITMNLSKYEMDKQYQIEQHQWLKNLEYDILIQSAYSRTQHMDMLAAFIKARKKIAFVSDESKSNISRYMVSRVNKKKLDGIYDELITTSTDEKMEIQRNADLIRGLGLIEFKSATPKLPETKYDVNVEGDYCVVFPGASTKVKMWDTQKYAQVIEYIFSNSEYSVLICGAKNEEYLYEEIASKTSQKERLKNFCGVVTLLELADVVGNAKFVLSNDTSGIHYAAAKGVPAVCPFGEYNYGRFLPYQADVNCDNVNVISLNMKCRGCANKKMNIKCLFNIFRTDRYLCVENIETERIINAIKAFL